MKFTKVITLLLVVCPLAGIAQKIKYEDVFLQLNAGNYAVAEPQLKAFMADPKNVEHANSYVQWGNILEKRFYGTDILADTALIAARADSAIQQFKKAIPLIDDKELKKNENLYQAFHRRDLRTGEFGIKLSDVHLDLEKKVENIGKRLKAVRTFRGMLHRISGRNNLSANIYKTLTTRTADYRQLLFSFSDDDLVLLDRMRDNAQGLYDLINEMKAAAKELGSNYYQNFTDFDLIQTYGVDGLAQHNMFDGRLELWDYETWATATRTDYYAVKQYLATISQKEILLAAAVEGIGKGERAEEIFLDDLAAPATKYDPDGTALALLNVKKAQLTLLQATSLTLNPDLADTSNIYNRLVTANQVMAGLGEIKTAFGSVAKPERIALAKARYAGIITKHYGGATGYDQYLTDFDAWIQQMEAEWGGLIARLQERDRFAVSATDRIPLFTVAPEETGRHLTLMAAGEETKMAFGIDAKTNEGFVVWSGPKRDITALKPFKAPGMKFAEVKAGILPTTKFAFYLFSTALPKNNLIVVHTSEAGQLKWVSTTTAPNEPVSFRYDETLDQVTVFYFPQDQLPPDGVTAYVVIDRAGTVR